MGIFAMLVFAGRVGNYVLGSTDDETFLKKETFCWRRIQQGNSPETCGFALKV